MYNLCFHRSFDTWKSATFVQELKKINDYMIQFTQISIEFEFSNVPLNLQLTLLKAVDIDNVSEFAPFHLDHCREHLHRSSIIISTRCFKFLPYFQKCFKIFYRRRVICKMSLCYDATV